MFAPFVIDVSVKMEYLDLVVPVAFFPDNKNLFVSESTS